MSAMQIFSVRAESIFKFLVLLHQYFYSLIFIFFCFMKKNLFTIVLFSIALVFSTSCNKDDDEKTEGKVSVPGNNVDYQLRVYITESQLNYLDCDVIVNVPGKEEQAYSLKNTNLLADLVDPVIDADIIELSGILDPQPPIYVYTFDYNGLNAGEARVRMNFSRNDIECTDSTETVDIVIGALWRARTEGQDYTQLGNDNSVYGGVYVRNLEEFLQTIGSSYEASYNFQDLR